MRQRSQDGAEDDIKILADVFGKKSHHEVAVLLQ